MPNIEDKVRALLGMGSNIEDKLIFLLKEVKDWLKFAEAKNAGLILFSGAAITAILTFLGSAQKLSHLLRIQLGVSIILLNISCLICLISLSPQSNLDQIIFKILKFPNKVPEEKDNLYFYGHLSKYDAVQLVDKIKRLYFEQETPSYPSKESIHIATQIVVNARICHRKYKLFYAAIWVTIIAITIIVVGFLLDIFYWL